MAASWRGMASRHRSIINIIIAAAAAANSGVANNDAYIARIRVFGAVVFADNSETAAAKSERNVAKIIASLAVASKNNAISRAQWQRMTFLCRMAITYHQHIIATLGGIA